jgi:O-methyltransferase
MDEQSKRKIGLDKTPDLRHRLGRRANQTLYLPRPAPVIFPVRKKMTMLYPFAGETIGDVAVTYLEFGVYRGDSMRKMAQIFTHADARFVGFDSFEGLPEAWGDKAPGTFSTDGEPPLTDDSRISFVKGYFQNSLPQFLSTFKFRAPTLVHYDADLYSSTLFLLTSLWHHIPEYYFIYDEFVPDEATAMYDFTTAYPVEFEFLACTARAETQDRPSQLFGRMKNIPLQP